MHWPMALALCCFKNLQTVQKNQSVLYQDTTDTEKKYSQVEKEGLACVFGVSRFHTYLFGHKFTLVTDNKAIISLFDPSRNVSPQAL